MQRHGIAIRARSHAGEVEIMGDDIGGIAVHMAARVVALSEANEVWTSRTAKDLVTASKYRFLERGAHALKGVPGEWLTDRTPDRMRSLVTTLVKRVEIGAESIEVEVCRQRLTSMLQARSEQPQDRNSDPEGILTLTIAARLQRSGREMRLVGDCREFCA